MKEKEDEDNIYLRWRKKSKKEQMSSKGSSLEMSGRQFHTEIWNSKEIYFQELYVWE